MKIQLYTDSVKNITLNSFMYQEGQNTALNSGIFNWVKNIRYFKFNCLLIGQKCYFKFNYIETLAKKKLNSISF